MVCEWRFVVCGLFSCFNFSINGSNNEAYYSNIKSTSKTAKNFMKSILITKTRQYLYNKITIKIQHLTFKDISH